MINIFPLLAYSLTHHWTQYWSPKKVIKEHRCILYKYLFMTRSKLRLIIDVLFSYQLIQVLFKVHDNNISVFDCCFLKLKAWLYLSILLFLQIKKDELGLANVGKSQVCGLVLFCTIKALFLQICLQTEHILLHFGLSFTC